MGFAQILEHCQGIDSSRAVHNEKTWIRQDKSRPPYLKNQLPKRVALAILITVYGVLFGILLLIQLVRAFRDLWTWILLDP